MSFHLFHKKINYLTYLFLHIFHLDLKIKYIYITILDFKAKSFIRFWSIIG